MRVSLLRFVTAKGSQRAIGCDLCLANIQSIFCVVKFRNKDARLLTRQRQYRFLAIKKASSSDEAFCNYHASECVSYRKFTFPYPCRSSRRHASHVVGAFFFGETCDHRSSDHKRKIEGAAPILSLEAGLFYCQTASQAIQDHAHKRGQDIRALDFGVNFIDDPVPFFFRRFLLRDCRSR